MISIWHLVWIVPISAVFGVFAMIYIVLVDDCMYWANKREGDDDRDNPR